MHNSRQLDRKTMTTSPQISLATRSDLTQVNAIYNAYVATSTCTYQEEPDTIAQREAWFDDHGDAHPVTVAKLNGEVVGWGSLSPYRARSGYRRTVENAVYVHPDAQRRGIGAALLADLIGRAKQLEHRTVIAVIDSEQAASIAIHERFGFVRAAYLREVGFKFGKWLDVIQLQKML